MNKNLLLIGAVGIAVYFLVMRKSAPTVVNVSSGTPAAGRSEEPNQWIQLLGSVGGAALSGLLGGGEPTSD